MQSMHRTLHAVLALLALGLAAAAKPYAGTQCVGVVDFALEDSANIGNIDGFIALVFGAVPKWLTAECQDAARTAQCGIKYGAVADVGSGMCKSQCEQILQPCAKAAGMNEQLAAIAGPEQACALLPDVNCVEVGELDESLHAEAECPSPLVTSKPHPGVEYEGFVLRVPGTGCAVGCPAGDTFFGETKNHALETLLFALSAFSVVAGLLVLVGLRPKGTRLYAWMFTFCGTVAAAAVLVYNCLSPREVLCDDGIGHRRRAPMMISVAACIHYFYLCAVAWICLQAFSTWMIVKTGTRRTKIERWQNAYIVVAFLIPAIFCSFPAAGDNYGWSPQVFLPFPMMLFEETEDYFWPTFYTPMVLMLAIQAALTIDASWAFFKLYKANRTGKSGVSSGRGRNFMHYNREPLLLMLAVGVFTFLNSVGVGYSLHQAKTGVRHGFEDYIRCLLETSASDEDGECVKSDFYFDLYFVVVVQCIYHLSYPIIALITFGPAPFVWRRVAWLAGLIATAPESRESVSETKHSNNTRGSMDTRRQRNTFVGSLQLKVLRDSRASGENSVDRTVGSTPAADDSMVAETHSTRIDDSAVQSGSSEGNSSVVV